MQWRGAFFGAQVVVVVVVAAMLAGCGGRKPGSFDVDDGPSNKLANLLAFNTSSAPAQPQKQVFKNVFCPEIIILEGTAANRVYSGAAANENLRYQYSLNDVARECMVQGDQIALKIGIEGRVLLGPVGAPGNFSVPIRIAVIRESDQRPIISKLYKVAAAVATGQTQGGFTLVSEPLLVPFTKEHAEDDYSIKVGIDTGPGGGGDDAPVKGRGKRAAAAQ